MILTTVLHLILQLSVLENHVSFELSLLINSANCELSLEISGHLFLCFSSIKKLDKDTDHSILNAAFTSVL